MRRGNGTGGIFKMPGKRRRPWIAVRTVGIVDGVQVRKCVGYFATKAEAEEALIRDRIMPASQYSKLTLEDVWEMWIDSRAFTKLTPQTQAGYKAAYQYMKEYSRDLYSDLRRNHFQAMIDSAQEMGKSWSTMSSIRTICTLLGEYATALDIVPHSYATKLVLPKKTKAEKRTFTEEEIGILFEHDSDPYVSIILILIGTGMRITELLTLRKTDVDIEQMLIVGGIKTDAGRNRTVPIHPQIQKYIRRWYGQSFQYLIEMDGKPLRSDSVRDRIYKVEDALGIRQLQPHECRHTFFTKMDEACSDKLAMALIGGHTDPHFTEMQYVHPDINRLRAAMETIKI